MSRRTKWRIIFRMVTYDEKHRAVIESGIENIRKSLFEEDIYYVRQILFCLDWYLDPFYKNNLPYKNEIYGLLQELVVSSNNDDIIEDCLQLIGDYCNDLSYLEENFDKIKDSMKQEVRRVLEDKRITLSYYGIVSMNNTCIIFKTGNQIVYSECANRDSRYSEKCIGVRNAIADPPYVEFFTSNGNTRVVFDRTGMFEKKKNQRNFGQFHIDIQKFGYSTFDLS